MEELKRQCGRPDIIVSNIFAQLQTQWPPSTHHKKYFHGILSLFEHFSRNFPVSRISPWTSFHSLYSLCFRQTSTLRKTTMVTITSYRTTLLSLILSFSTPCYQILPLRATICQRTFQQPNNTATRASAKRKQQSTEHAEIKSKSTTADLSFRQAITQVISLQYLRRFSPASQTEAKRRQQPNQTSLGA